MKKQYFLLILVWLLFAVSGCKDGYRSVVLFEGAEPVYQVGTCDNLVSSLAFFLSETEGETVLGIDGGDGAYTLTNEHESVAAVTFAGDSNGYRRISIQPLAAGETVVRVMDGSGSGAQLRITVKERREYKMSKQGFEYGISGDAPVELLGKVSEELSGRSWLEDSGYYVLIPDKGSSYYLDKGVLEIYPTGKEDAPLTGSYETVPMAGEDGDVHALWRFTYDGEQRIFTRSLAGSEGVATVICVLAENVTPFCSPGLLPEGVTVIYREHFLLKLE